jgi:mevalonate kinase
VSIQPRPESYSCRATVKGRRVTGSGIGGCTLRVAKKKTRGKKLTVVVSVTYQGATKSVPFTFVVS